jgi:predicted acetyltransferase
VADQLTYRFAQDQEIGDIGRLVAHSFPGPARTPPWWEEQLRSPAYGGGPETLFVGRDGTRFAAACQIHPLRQWVGGEVLRTAGIGTVAVSPAYRRRGIGADLVAAALRAAHARGDVAASLYPFRVAFYRKLGWGQAGEALQYEVPPAALPDADERRGVEILGDGGGSGGGGGSGEAFRLYGRWARTQNGQLERTARLWLDIATRPDTVLAGYRADSGALEGYAIAIYRTELPRTTRFLEVDELIWTTPQARAGLYAWLASLGDQWDRVLLRALPSQRLGDCIREPRLPYDTAPSWRLWAPAATLLHGPMFRLVDMRACWERRRIVPIMPARLRIELVDEQLEENGGTWRLAFDGERVHVAREGSADLTIRTDVSTLSRIYIGSLSPGAALETGLLECDRPDRLSAIDAALALPEPWTFDRF